MNKLKLLIVSISLLALNCTYAKVIPVVNLDDSGMGSLREAVNVAISGDTILVDVSGTIGLNSPVVIDGFNGLTILGPFPKHNSISGSAAWSTGTELIRVQNSSGVKITQLGFIGGYSDVRAISIDNTSGSAGNPVSIDQCLFEGFNQSSIEGGAVYSAGQSAEIQRCSFINNSAVKGGAISLGGGGNTKIYNCTFWGNSSSFEGGVAYVSGSVSLVLMHNTFYENNSTNNLGELVYAESGPQIMMQNNAGAGNDTSIQFEENSAGTYSSNGGNVIRLNFNGEPIPWSQVGSDNSSQFIIPGLRSSILEDGFGLKYFTITNSSSNFIDQGNSAGVPPTDIRRAPRILYGGLFAGNPDAGACEFTLLRVENNSGSIITGSLSTALSNSFDPVNYIEFDIPGGGPHVITPTNPLGLSNAYIVDAYSQPGSAIPGPEGPGNSGVIPANIAIEINSAGGVSSGFEVTYTGVESNVIQGFRITNFPSYGINIASSKTKVFGNEIGFQSDLSENGNDLAGIFISGSANVIGGTQHWQRNVVSGNGIGGTQAANIYVNSGGTSNYVVGNFVGIGPNGMQGIIGSNGTYGVRNQGGSTILGENTIGGSNVIGNNTVGIFEDASDSPQIYNNKIGVGYDGILPLSNSDYGVNFLYNGADAAVGKPGQFKNIISGNSLANIRIGDYSSIIIENNLIGVDSTGDALVTGNGVGILIDDVNADIIKIGDASLGGGNVISGNTDGIRITNCGPDVIITNNFIGTNDKGLAAVNNSDNGIELDNSVSNPVIIGQPNFGNVISGNLGVSAIRVFATENHAIQSNIIGLDKNGDGIIPNNIGINIISSNNIKIGGDVSFNEGNIISGNATGIAISSGTGNQISGNYLGLDITGNLDRGNTNQGIQIANGTNNYIGGDPTKRNIISGSPKGILLNGSGSGTVVASNLIGSNASGNTPIPNQNGIVVNQTHEVQIGGTITPNDMRNYITSSTLNGILIYSPNTVVEGNVIGLGLGNASAGMGNDIGIKILVSNVKICPNIGSVISNNSSYGIEIEGADSCSVDRCIIGADGAVTNSFPNSVGILIDGGGYNEIGGASPNTIVANTAAGVAIQNSGKHNKIIRNTIGNTTLGNNIGIWIYQGSNKTTIGGNIIGNGNEIYGNASEGIKVENTDSTIITSNFIGTDASNINSSPNSIGIRLFSSNKTTIGGEDSNGNGTYNVISSNTNEGILIESCDSTFIYGNRIGTNVTGNGTLPNNIGIKVNSTTTNTFIGESGNELYGNTISGNTDVGVLIDGATDTYLYKNKIGCDFTAVSGLGGQITGVELINGASTNYIGGNRFLEGNLIAGNSTDGVVINNSSNNLVEGNIIGMIPTNPQNNGVVITGASSTNNSIGTPPYTSTGNVISMNSSVGVKIEQGANSNMIQSNLIGLDSTNSATATITQPVGVEITNAAGIDNYVGTSTPGGGNIISANQVGVQINGVSNQLVYNNGIGVDTSGMFALPNTLYGVHLLGTASSNTIGGPISSKESNLISGNPTGVQIQDSGTQNNVLSGNVIGMNKTITDSIPNNVGIVIDLSANLNSIGTTGLGNGNIISGNKTGITIKGGATQNDVVNNEIGVQNSNVYGVVINNGATNNVIGGGAAERNIVSGNDSTAIAVLNSNSNSILGNYIGMEADGITPLPNLVGIYFGNASLNTIGDPTTGNGNLISANQLSGIILENSNNDNVIQNNLIGTDNTGNNAFSSTANTIGIYFTSSNNNTIGGDNSVNEGNVICGNTGPGIFLDSASNNTISGNNVGLSKDNSTYMGNGQEGILLTSNSNGNFIGTSGSGFENVVTANLYGIHLKNSSGNSIANNFVGNDDTGGESTLPTGTNQQLIGVVIDTLSPNNTISEKNVISGNALYGLAINGPGANQNIVQSNHIGVNFSGNVSYANDSINVIISGGAKQNIIGGPSSTERNIIGGDADFQVLISKAETDSNQITGNYIGVGLDQNTTYNTLAGIVVDDSASYNLIGGGTSPSGGNYIPSSNGFGIYLGERVSYTKIQGNKIGIKPNGSNGNIDSTGIRMHGSDWNQIGGILVNSDSANVIANCKTGVDLKTHPVINSSYGNAIIGNSIYDNQLYGIDINADELVLPIDTNQNLGNNGEIDRPMLLTAWNCGVSGNTHVGFEFYSNNALAGYKVEFYSNTSPDPSGYGEGETYLGHWVFNPATNVDTIDIDLGTSLAVGTSITATITGTLFNTSEFSQNITVSDPPTFNAPTTVPETCLGAGDGQIQINAPGAYYFSIDGGTNYDYGNGGDTLMAASGNYTVIAKYLNGCELTQTIVLDPGTTLPFNTTTVADTCGINSGMIIIDTSITNASGGTGSYLFSYDNGTTFGTADTANNLSSGIYNVVIQDDSLGCYSDTIAVTVPSVKPPGPTISSTKTIYCPQDSLVEMQVSAQTNDTINWYDNSNLSNVVASGSSYLPNSLNEGDNYFYATYVDSSGCESLPDSINYVQVNTSDMYTDSSRSVCIGSEITLNAYGGVLYNWQESTQITGALDDSVTQAKILAEEDFIVSITNFIGCVITDTISILLLPADECHVDVYNAFSPNNDGTNDYWEIDGIEGFPENRVLIYNRWGDVVKSFENYDNVNVIWDGTGRNGKPLHAGTYFYVVEVGTEQNQAGWVQIVK